MTEPSHSSNKLSRLHQIAPPLSHHTPPQLPPNLRLVVAQLPLSCPSPMLAYCIGVIKSCDSDKRVCGQLVGIRSAASSSIALCTSMAHRVLRNLGCFHLLAVHCAGTNRTAECRLLSVWHGQRQCNHANLTSSYFLEHLLARAQRPPSVSCHSLN